jgi:branched-subunit amino acid transport protein AzlD
MVALNSRHSYRIFPFSVYTAAKTNTFHQDQPKIMAHMPTKALTLYECQDKKKTRGSLHIGKLKQIENILSNI